MTSMVEKMARAMRERYAEITGETPLVAWDKSRAREEWLACALAALRAIRPESTSNEVYRFIDSAIQQAETEG